MNGPVPTGLMSGSLVGSAMEDQRCSGTISVCAIDAANGTFGVVNLMVTSLPLADTELICAQTPLVSRAGYFFRRLKVKATSPGVKSLPSLHLTPWRIV